MNNKKIFELPYNFDTKLIDFLDIYFEGRKEDGVHAIYFPPFKKDYIAAKEYVEKLWTGGPQVNSYPKTREEYSRHIKYIQKSFPNQLMLLLQNPTQMLSDELLDWYVHTFNINKFCVGSIEQAKILKEYNSEFEIIGSIVMKVDKEKLLSNSDYEKYFDGFVLWFPFNRDLQAIADLPKNFKYVLFVNGGCHIHCQGTHHWFSKSWEEDKECFNKCSPLRKDPLTSIIIRPMDLIFFDPYITYFKIQGREWDTMTVIQHIVLYDTNMREIFCYIHYHPELYQKDLQI